MYKLLVLDLDGTLLNENHEISEMNKIMIEEAKERGVKIILSSGREPSSVKHFSEELKLNELISSLNGGMITDSNVEKIYFNECLDETLAKNAIYTLEKMKLCGVVFIGDRIYTQDKKDSRFDIYKNYAVADIDEVGELSKFLEKKNLWGKVNKILLADKNNILNKYKDLLLEEKNADLTVQFSLPFFLEVYSSNVSKGRALERISNFYGIDKEHIIAIGDGENDIDMIKFAGLGVAMDNAPNLVKESADIITLSNSEDGVSKIIREYIVK